MNKVDQPVVIIGMHRSGTSMITRMLKDLGLFVGWDLQVNHEATFFVRRNERILAACGGGWDHPTVVDKLLNHSELRKKVHDYLRDDLSSFHVFSYTGPKYYVKYGTVTKFNFPWGWKDPRNTFLLPIWLDIFPSAKIIHIFRNGIDVARSLAARDENRIGRVLNRGSFSMRQANLLKEKGFLRYILTRLYDANDRLDPLSKYSRLRLYSYMSMEAGFELWCDYVKKGFDCLENSRNEGISIRYEDFLLQPTRYLRKLVEFCHLPPNEEKIDSVASTINPIRRYAFKNDNASMNFYQTVKDNYWMDKLGYTLKRRKKSG